MWTKPFARFAASLPIAFVGLALGPGVSFAVPCLNLASPGSPAVYVAGSTAAEPLVRQLAQSLTRDDPTKLTIIWQMKSSCGGAEAVARDTMPASCATGACIKGKALAWTVDPRDLQPAECDLDLKGNKVDLAISDVAPSLCPGLAGPPISGVLDSLGPVSAYGVVMAAQAGETAIHAEEAHFVFGTGKNAGVKP